MRTPVERAFLAPRRQGVICLALPEITRVISGYRLA